MSKWLLRIASLYLVIGVCFGIVMGATHNFLQAPVHAHLNLLGWVTLGMVGLLYTVRPEYADTGLAKAHFVLHNLGLPVMMGALFYELQGVQAAGPVLGVGSLVVGLGIACLALNIWRVSGRSA